MVINLIHGDAGRYDRAPEYEAWKHVKQRCYNPKNRGYKNYGGRGIEMCDRWFWDYSTFLADMGRKPTSLHMLSRVNNDGNYEPSNCIWELRLEQNRNRRSVKMNMAKAREARRLFDNGWCVRDIAKKFRVKMRVIEKITGNLTWRER